MALKGTRCGKYVPRLSIDLTEEQYFALQDMLPFGTKKEVFSMLVDDLIRIVGKHGAVALGAILSGDIGILEFLQSREKNNG
jgi:hypothetical protein